MNKWVLKKNSLSLVFLVFRGWGDWIVSFCNPRYWRSKCAGLGRCRSNQRRYFAFHSASLILLLLIFSQAEATTVTITSSGNWTAPAGVTTITVEAWGGGGGGGAATANPAKGGGGGGGGYAKNANITVVPADSYPIVIGAGGSGGTTGGVAAVSGGDSTFNGSMVVAKGGSSGETGNVANGTATAGSGVLGGIGDVGSVFVGGSGSSGVGNTAVGGAGGGGAGSGGAGGNASGNTAGTGTATGGGNGGSGRTNGGAGNTGSVYGGGGGGGYRNTGTSRAGGAGAAGRVVITYQTPPTVATNAASAVTGTGAQLNGAVSSNGASTTVTFEYGLTTSYGSMVAATQSPLASNASNATVSAAITGLSCNTVYHFRVNGLNSSGATINGSDRTFTTSSCAPTVTTDAATALTSSGATLNGKVSSNGARTTVTFDYGLTTAYGSTATAAQSPLAASSAPETAVSTAVTGLTCNTLYHYRVKGVNSLGTANGNDLTFTTSACLPTATTNAASNITSWVATLNGTVTSSAAEASTVTFEYGLTTSYGESITATQSPLAAGAANTAVSYHLEGLSCNTTFHYRVIATNSGGTAYGSDKSFTTAACSGPYPATACAATRYGSDLGCSASDVSLSHISPAPGSITSCVSGAPVTLDLDVQVNFASPSRWDIGIFIANDGKLPTVLPGNGGATSCSVDVLPATAPFLDLDGVPQGTTDSCGDGNGAMNGGTGSGVKRVTGVTLPCYAAPGSGGNLFVPYTLSWDNQKSPIGSLCTSNLDPVPNTASKCNAPAATVSIGIVVLPRITKTDGRDKINPGANTSYTVVITNDTGGTLQDSIFKDPAVTDLTVNSVSCAAADGATCPSISTSAMQGSGISIPSANLPNNSSLTFTIDATVSSSAILGSNLVNTASVSIGSATNTAADTDQIVNLPAAAKSFSPSAISENAGSVLTITLSNPTTSAVTGVAFTDSYPSGLVNSASAGGATTCGGTVTAANGGSSLALSGGTIPANGSCTVTVNVTSATAGSYTNSTGTVTTNSGDVSAASAQLTVEAPVFGAFNACDTAAVPNSICTSTTTSTNSRIKTKIAGSPFSLDIVALKTDGSRNTSYNNTVKVELLDASDNSGALDSYNCRSSWTTIITTLGTNPVFANTNNGLITVGTFTVAQAYRDVRVRITNMGGSTKKGCSTDDFSIRPNSLTVSATDIDWLTAGTTRTLNNTDASIAGSATGSANPIHKAGQPFTVKAIAKNASDVTTTNFSGTPTSTLSVCTGGSACTSNLGALTLGSNSAASGTLTWSSVSYDGIGAFDLTLQDTSFTSVDAVDTPATCVGRYVCGTTTVGRFVSSGYATTPTITKTNGVSAINAGDTTTYTVVIGNNSGGLLQDMLFRDPAVTNLTVNSVSCMATNGASCPASVTVADMQGTGISISSASLPDGSSLTFTINATLSSSASVGNVLSNTAYVSADGFTSTATDSDTVSVGVNSFNAFETSTAINAIDGKIYTKLAGIAFNLDIVAISGSVQASSFNGNVKIELLANTGTAGTDYGTDNCPTANSVIQTITSTAITNGRSGASFSAVSNAYRDVRVRISYPVSSPTIIICSTDNFSIRPIVFTVSSTDATNTTTAGTPAIKAGANFNLTATAVPGYDGTPFIDSSQVVGTNQAGTIGGSFGVAASSTGVAAGGAFTYSEVGNFGLNNNAVYDDSFTLVDQSPDCTPDFSTTLTEGKYGCNIGSNSVSQVAGVSGFGRFIPDHFLLSDGSLTNRSDINAGAGCSPQQSTFTYMGEPIRARFTLTAQNASNSTTQNYSGDYVKFSNPVTGIGYNTSNSAGLWAIGINFTSGESSCNVLFDDVPNLTPSVNSFVACSGPTPTLNIGRASGPRVTATSPTVSVWNSGAATFTMDVTLERGDVPAGAYETLNIGIAPQDSDGVKLSLFDLDADNNNINERASLGTTRVLFGRISLRNVYGSELLALPMPMSAEFWDGSSWVTNAADSCTTLASPVVESGLELNLDNNGTTMATLNSPLVSGDGGLILSAPGITHAGYADITIINSPAWLDFNWDGADQDNDGNLFDDNPRARGTFGVYEGNSRFIYIRELY